MADGTWIAERAERMTIVNRPLPIVAAVGLAAVIFGLSLALPLRLGVLYLAAVWVAAQSRSSQAVIGVAGFATVLRLVALVAKPMSGAQTAPALTAAGLSLLAIWTTAALALQWLQAERARQNLRRSADELGRKRADALAAANRQLKAEVAERQQGDAVRSRLVDILDRSPDCVAVVRVDGRLVYLNQAGRQLLGIAAGGEVAQTRISEVYPQRLHSAFESEVLPAAVAEGMWKGEFTLVRSGQQEVPVAMVVLAHRSAEQTVEYWAIVAQEISDQKAAQRALRESESRLRAIFEAAMDCIITVDVSGKIVEFNRAAEKTFRCSRTAVMGQELAEMFLPLASRQRYRRNLDRYQALGEGSMLGKRLELLMHRSDGDEFMAQIAIQPVALKGEPVFTVFLQDITERKKAEHALARRTEELARSNSDLAQFAYVASHDLLEPLRAVSSHCQMLQLKYEGKLDEAADEHIGFAVSGAARMQRLIGDLLSYSRVGTEGRPFEQVSSKQMVDEALQNLGVAIQESGASVRYQQLPTVTADPRQLPQLFQNLIGNAIKYRTEEAPEIRLSAQRRGRDWLFRVEDNGIGIEPEHAERIFVIFKRLHGRNRYSGTGIGLAICKKIVERHGGKIWVEPAPERGSIFCFTLPVSNQGNVA